MKRRDLLKALFAIPIAGAAVKAVAEKPWEECFTAPTESPRRVSSATSRSTSDVLPTPDRPTNPTTGMARSRSGAIIAESPIWPRALDVAPGRADHTANARPLGMTEVISAP